MLSGPFSSTEMAEWFSAGYFTMNLLVKRGCDDLFQPLGELIKRWGRVPFLNGPTPPPLKVKMFPLIISCDILSRGGFTFPYDGSVRSDI